MKQDGFEPYLSAGCPFLINPKNYIREKDNERDLLAQDTNEKGELKKKKDDVSRLQMVFCKGESSELSGSCLVLQVRLSRLLCIRFKRESSLAPHSCPQSIGLWQFIKKQNKIA